MHEEIRIKPDLLHLFCQNVFKRIGLNDNDAFLVSDSIVFANLHGIDSHGVMRLPFYIKRLKEGGSKVNPNISIIKEKNAYALIDGDNGMGQVIGAYAANMAVEKAKISGISFIGVRGSAHFGAASYYSNIIAREKMIGFSTTNTTQNLAAWGGATKVLGNNPIAISVPYRERKPLALDISMSRVAGGKIKLYAKDGRKIPKGWGLDKYGRHTEDPNDIINGGTYLPFGDHKGYGLAVMLEILNGVLTGANILSQNISWWKYPEKPLNLGQCFAAINIEDFVGITNFNERLLSMIKEIKSSPLCEASQGVYMPGEIELAIEEERRKKGIPISQAIWEDLNSLSRTYHIAIEKIDVQ